MGTIEITGYEKSRIRSFNDWERFALPPNRKQHWKEGRSAFELGRSWTTHGAPTVPADLTHVLNSHPDTVGMLIVSGIAERTTILPFGNGGPRCHDLALRAEQNGLAATICIEAKADEPFGGSVREELRKARASAKKRSTNTKFPERLDWLARSLLGLPAFMNDSRTLLSEIIAELPYQLFAAIAGTLLESESDKAVKAVFIVHEFRTALTTDAKMEINSQALDRFLSLLVARNGGTNDNFHLELDRLFGPISISKRLVVGQRQMPCLIPLFVGKIRTVCI
jgi:hypothetical protein